MTDQLLTRPALKGPSRALASAALAVLLLISLAACTPPNSSVSAEDNAQALERYADLERATLPQLEEQYPGLYSEASVESDFTELEGQSGEYSVVMYHYTYADEMDHPATAAALDEQKSTFDDTCRTALFPAMRKTGVTGPLGAQWSYSDSSGEIWSYACTSD